MATYFTYLLKWTNQNKSYYGVRYCRNCHPTSLWTTYFSSSKVVKGFRQRYGEPDIVQVRKTFTEKNKAFLWEQRVLKRLNVITNENWLNMNIGGYPGAVKHVITNKNNFIANNPMKNEESRQKLSKTRKDRKLGIASAVHLHPKYGDDNPMRNPEHLAEYKKKITGRKRQYLDDGSWVWDYSAKEKGNRSCPI